MGLDDYEPVFNTSIKLRSPLHFDEKQVIDFFGHITLSVPALNEYRQTDKDFHLLEMRAGNTVRQIVFRQDEIKLAVAPPLGMSVADETARVIYPLIREHVRPSPLLIEHVDMSLRFAFRYEGNHDLLVLHELFGGSPFAEIARGIQGAVREFQPSLNVSLTTDHSVVAVVEIQTSTSEREIESGVFDGDEIRLVCGVARTRDLAQQPLEAIYASVHDEAVRFVEGCVLGSLVERLRDATTRGSAQTGEG